MSVTGELPRQMVFSRVQFEKQKDSSELAFSKPGIIVDKEIRFVKIFKVLGFKLSEEKQGEVMVCLVAGSSVLNRTTPPLEVGDVLVRIDGNQITSKKQAEKIISNLSKGEHIIEARSQKSKDLKEELQESVETIKHKVEVYNIKLIARNKQDMFGLEFEGGIEMHLGDVYVRTIVPNSPASESKQIRIGDQLLNVNNISYIGISFKEAIRMYENLPLNQSVLFILQRRSASANENAFVNPSPLPVVRNISLGDRILEVELERGGDNKLGVVLSGGSDTGDKRVYIRRIGPNSIVANDGRLKVSV